MKEILQSSTYTAWFSRLRDHEVRARIRARIYRMQLGNFGDVKPVGQGVSELRIPIAGGIRIYFMQRGRTVIVLLAGGDKSTQSRDIAKAKQIAMQWED